MTSGRSDPNLRSLAGRVLRGGTVRAGDSLVALAIPLLVWQLLLWSIVGVVAYRAPQIDSAEQFVWSISLENGYWKHPPLPSWLMHLLVQSFGPSVALPLVATQVGMAIALLLLLRLASEMMPAPRALAAMALTSLVTYFNIGADSFNHSTVLLPFLAALLLAFHAAVRRGGLHRWALVGLFAGLAMLVKYLAILQVAGLLLYLVLDRRTHERRTGVGLAMAAVVGGLTMLPHLLWLQSNDFLPLQYARSVTHASGDLYSLIRSVYDFILMQCLRLLPLLLGAWLGLRSNRPALAAMLADTSRRDRLFLWAAGATPLLLEIAFALATRTELQSRWGGTGFMLAGLLLLAHWPRTVSPVHVRRTLIVVASLQALLCLSSSLGQTVIAERLHRPTRANFPGAVLAQRALDTWGTHTRSPLRLVVSDIWLGGNVIANTPSQSIAVLIDGHRFMSPWVRDEAIHDCGALVMDDLSEDEAGHAVANPALESLFARADATGQWLLPWAQGVAQTRSDARGVVRWGVILPQPGHECRTRH